MVLSSYFFLFYGFKIIIMMLTCIYLYVTECWKMGCVTSKKDINDLYPNIFQVFKNSLIS